MEMVPEGLRFIATLQRFTIRGADDKFNNKLRRVNGKEGEDFYKVRHVSSLNIIGQYEERERERKEIFCQYVEEEWEVKEEEEEW
ncbi:unnamed protein product [Camellia sinensis]